MPVTSELLHALAIMNLLFVSAAWSLARPSLASSAVLVVVAVMWVLGNGPIEGNVLIHLNIHHGLTESDLLSGAAVVIAAVGALRARRAAERG